LKNREIRFRSKSVSESGGVYRVSGTLEIKGKARDVSFDLRNSGDNLEAKVRLHQPDYGVKPYSAMLGALKIKPDIDVLVKLPKKLVG
jgi:polyisoprenoid-binding protein YceI